MHPSSSEFLDTDWCRYKRIMGRNRQIKKWPAQISSEFVVHSLTNQESHFEKYLEPLIHLASTANAHHLHDQTETQARFQYHALAISGLRRAFSNENPVQL